MSYLAYWKKMKATYDKSVDEKKKEQAKLWKEVGKAEKELVAILKKKKLKFKLNDKSGIVKEFDKSTELRAQISTVVTPYFELFDAHRDIEFAERPVTGLEPALKALDKWYEAADKMIAQQNADPKKWASWHKLRQPIGKPYAGALLRLEKFVEDSSVRTDEKKKMEAQMKKMTSAMNAHFRKIGAYIHDTGVLTPGGDA